MELIKQFDFQITNLAKFALAMTCFIENIANVEALSFPIHYALKSVCGRKQVKASKNQIYISRSLVIIERAHSGNLRTAVVPTYIDIKAREAGASIL